MEIELRYNGEGMNPLVQSGDKSHARQSISQTKKKGAEITSLFLLEVKVRPFFQVRDFHKTD